MNARALNRWQAGRTFDWQVAHGCETHGVLDAATLAAIRKTRRKRAGAKDDA